MFKHIPFIGRIGGSADSFLSDLTPRLQEKLNAQFERLNIPAPHIAAARIVTAVARNQGPYRALDIEFSCDQMACYSVNANAAESVHNAVIDLTRAWQRARFFETISPRNTHPSTRSIFHP